MTEGRRRFRPEIEGLRAVAALLVAVYHVYLGRVSGGVDVFFVVSGFLVTTSLLGQVSAEGAVHVGRFLRRLARRLLPLALTVLAAVLVANALLMPVTRRADTARDVVASALYVENWALAARSVDYLAQGEAKSPLQHFWAMSIQGQFYLLWLALFLVVVAVATRARLPVRAVLAAGLGAVAIGSFTASVLMTAANQPLAYFHTGARAWEFAVGGILALVLTGRPRCTGTWSAVGGWLGLALLVACGLVLPVATAFPGWIALWPVTAAVLVVLAGDAPRWWGVTRLLGARPMRYLGGISYGLYLWHWPVLIFFLARTGRTEPGLRSGAAIIALSIALAAVSTRLVERPVRTAPAERRWPTRVLAAGVAGTVAAAGFVVAARPAEVPPPGPGAAAVAAGFAQASHAQGPLDLVAASADMARVYADRCHQTMQGSELLTCSYGDVDSDVTIMLVGGSHAAHWFPALEPIATARGWHLVVATKSACLFTLPRGGESDRARSCRAWNDALLEEILHLRPDLVVTTATRVIENEETVPSGYVDRWRRLAERDIPVLGLRDTPRPGFDVPDCLATHGLDSPRCVQARATAMAPVCPFEDLADPPSNVTLVDLTEYFCDDEACPPVIGDVVVYYDDSHITATYAATLAPMLAEHLDLPARLPG